MVGSTKVTRRKFRQNTLGNPNRGSLRWSHQEAKP